MDRGAIQFLFQIFPREISGLDAWRAPLLPCPQNMRRNTMDYKVKAIFVSISW